MKQIVPFYKEITFKSKIGEITSIALDHDLDLKDDDTIAGYFYLKGSYKMLSTSEIETEYNYKIPVEIAISDKYDAFLAKATVDDFNYEIDEDLLKINVDVLIENLELKKVKDDQLIRNTIDYQSNKSLDLESKKTYNDIKSDSVNNVSKNIDNEDKRCYEKEDEILDNKIILEKESKINEVVVKEETLKDKDESDLMSTSTNMLIEEETYLTYSVYLIKEEDTLESILNNYKVSASSLEEYNDITNITSGMKLIIPNLDD